MSFKDIFESMLLEGYGESSPYIRSGYFLNNSYDYITLRAAKLLLSSGIAKQDPMTGRIIIAKDVVVKGELMDLDVDIVMEYRKRTIDRTTAAISVITGGMFSKPPSEYESTLRNNITEIVYNKIKEAEALTNNHNLNLNI